MQNEKHKAEYCYISWLARCYIMNGNPRQAWEVYLKVSPLTTTVSTCFLDRAPGAFISPHVATCACMCMTCARLLCYG